MLVFCVFPHISILMSANRHISSSVLMGSIPSGP